MARKSKKARFTVNHGPGPKPIASFATKAEAMKLARELYRTFGQHIYVVDEETADIWSSPDTGKGIHD